MSYRIIITQRNGRELTLGPLDDYAGASDLAEDIASVPEVLGVRLEGWRGRWACLWSIEQAPTKTARIRVAEMISALPIPDGATDNDVLAILDEIADEVQAAKRLYSVVAGT